MRGTRHFLGKLKALLLIALLGPVADRLNAQSCSNSSCCVNVGFNITVNSITYTNSTAVVNFNATFPTTLCTDNGRTLNSIYSATLNFGDGTPVSGAYTPGTAITHTYNLPAPCTNTTFVIQACVANEGGTILCSKTQTISVGNPASPYVINVVNSSCKTFTLAYTGPAPLQNVQWNFGDGQLSGVITNTAQNSVVHTYSAGGTYYVALAGEALGPCPVYAQITVPDFVTPDFTYSVTSGCTVTPITVSLAISNYTSANTYSWVVNSNTFAASGMSGSYTTYFQAGPNVVTSIVTNSLGCKTAVTKIIMVPSANAYTINTPTIACKTVTFSYTGTWPLYNAQWAFGDGATSTVMASPTITTVVHTYPGAGTYVVSLSGDGIDPCEKYTQITISDFTTADFTYTVNNVCTPTAGIVLAIANYTNYTYSWVINGLIVPAIGPGASATYFSGLLQGLNTIKLVITNGSGCTTSIIKQVQIGPPPANFAVTSPSVCLGSALSVYNVSAGGDTYTWDIQKPSSTWEPPINGMNPNYIFTVTGTHLIKLTVQTDIGPCTNTAALSVNVFAQPVAAFSVSPISCNNSVTLSITSSTFTSYQLSYGNAGSFSGGSSIPGAQTSFTFPGNGSYPISLLLNNGGCISTYSQNVIINTSQPVLQITSNSPYLCPEGNTGINATVSNIPPGAGTLTYSWTGPSSFTANTQNITVTNAGNYSLTINSNGACPITLSGTKSITALAQPGATLTGFTNITCLVATGSATLSIPVALQKQGFYVNGTLTAANPSASSPLTYTVGNLGLGSNYITIANALSQSCNVAIPVNITQTQPSLNVAVTQPQNCTPGTGSANLTVTPSGGTASWYTLANYPNTAFTTGNSASGLAPGHYVIRHVTGSCTTTANFTVVQPVINITKTGGNGSCGGATSPVTLNAQFSPSVSGTFSFTLKKFIAASFTTIATGATNTFALASGNYSVQVTSNGCSATYTFPVIDLEPLTVKLKVNEPTCKNFGDITALASGGDGNYNYKWYWNGSLNGTQGPVLGLSTLSAQATISVTVNDQSGCVVTSSPAAVVNPVSQVSLTSCTAPGLQGLQNATKISGCEISACVIGGYGPYTFEWYREEKQETYVQWKFFFQNGVFKAFTGNDTLIVPVPTSTANLNLTNNTDFSIGSVSYPTWSFTTTPTATPMVNPAGLLALGSPVANSTNFAHYYKVPETVTTTVDVLVSSYSGNSGQTASNAPFKNGNYKLAVTDAHGCRYVFTIGTLTFAATTTVSVGFDFVWGISPIEVAEPAKDPALQDLMSEAAADLLNQAAKCMQKKEKAIKDFVTNTCSDLNTFKDKMSISYEVVEHHYTLYYYDRAGRLIKTVPPEGVKYLNQSDINLVKSNRSSTVTPSTWPSLSHSIVTTYSYNSFGQLLSQNTPDGGTTNFIYDSKNRLRFSQNGKQAAQGGRYSYTKYDAIGRIIEVGETVPVTGGPVFTGITAPVMASNTAVADNSVYPQTQNYQITRNFYSAATGITYYGKAQRYTQNRVSYTVLDESPLVTGDEHYIYNSYDAHGNVEWVVQDQPGGMARNYIGYEYDLVSGKILKVKYNEKRQDRFYHRFQYDAENRLLKAETSRNGELWDSDAAYSYYPHGPIKRQTIGEDHVQGLDYIYTIQGWMKSVNSPSLLTSSDPGLDNNTATLPASGKPQDRTAADRFGMVLNYYNADYTTTPTSNFLVSNTRYAMASYNGTAGAAPSLYNGNISSWIHSQLNNVATAPILPRADLFKYDILNRIRQSTSLNEDGGASGWAAISGTGRNYRTKYGYDANGNILHLSRYDDAGAVMDSLIYTYENTSPGLAASINNRLQSVSDATANALTGRGDLENTHNYSYDAIGNLTQETGQERLVLGSNPVAALYNFTTTISWTVYDKIKQINKTTYASPNNYNERITFSYNALGQRVKKDYWKDNTASPDNLEDPKEIITTFYVRDAQGNALATYQRFFDAADNLFKIQLIEQPIYGSERVGENVARVTLASSATFANLSLPGNGSATLSEYQNWITTSSKTQLLPNGMINDNLCQCRVVSLNSTNNAAYQTTNPDVSFLGIAHNGVALAENLSKQLQFYVVLAKKYLGAADVCLVFDKNGRLMKGTDNIGSVDINSKPVIVAIPGSTKYAIVTLNSAKQPKYHIVDMNLAGYGPVGNSGEVIAVNQALTGAYAGQTTHGYHFSGVEDHITGHSIVYSSRYTVDPIDPNKGTTELMAYDFGTSTLTPVPSTLHSIYGCGNTEAGEIQIAPDGGKLAWFQYDKYLAGFAYRRGDIYTLPLNNLRTGLISPPTLQPISEAGNYGDGVLEFMKNANDILYSQRGVYKQGPAVTKYERNVWKYDPVNNPVFSAINPNVSPLISYLYGEIKRGVDGNYYIPNMGRPVDQVHSYSGGTFSNVSITDTTYKLASSLPTQVYKVFADPSQDLSEYGRLIGQKSFELKDHLGNVRVVISDAKYITDNGTANVVDNADTYTPEVLNYNDYYPFGMQMPGRKYQVSSAYRYGFNGKEKDDEISGGGVSYDYGFRIYDARIAKFLSVDPLTKSYPWYTPYQFAGNLPIWAVDLDGLEEYKVTKKYTQTSATKATLYVEIGWNCDGVLPACVYSDAPNTRSESSPGAGDADRKADVYVNNQLFSRGDWPTEFGLTPKIDRFTRQMTNGGAMKLKEGYGQNVVGRPDLWKNETFEEPIDIYSEFFYSTNVASGAVQNQMLYAQVYDLLANTELKATLSGHTSRKDNVTGPSNQELSDQRAADIKTLMLTIAKNEWHATDAQIEELSNRIATEGKGEERAIERGRAEGDDTNIDRSVEIKITLPPN